MTVDAPAVLATVEELVRLVEWLARWLEDEPGSTPESASLMALAQLVGDPQHRTPLVEMARTNPVLRAQLEALARTHGDKHPTIRFAVTEI